MRRPPMPLGGSIGWSVAATRPGRVVSEMPQRIQRKRTKGWRMPEGAVYVGRPTRWGNPWRVVKSECCPTWDVIDDNGVRYLVDHGYVHLHGGRVTRDEAAREAVQLYAEIGVHELDLAAIDIRTELQGKDLACWCPLGAPCHADVLLEIANGGEG